MLVTFNQVKHHPHPQTLLTIYDKLAVAKRLFCMCDVTYKGGLILCSNNLALASGFAKWPTVTAPPFVCTNQEVTMGHHLNAL